MYPTPSNRCMCIRLSGGRRLGDGSLVRRAETVGSRQHAHHALRRPAGKVRRLSDLPALHNGASAAPHPSDVNKIQFVIVDFPRLSEVRLSVTVPFQTGSGCGHAEPVPRRADPGPGAPGQEAVLCGPGDPARRRDDRRKRGERCQPVSRVSRRPSGSADRYTEGPGCLCVISQTRHCQIPAS